MLTGTLTLFVIPLIIRHSTVLQTPQKPTQEITRVIPRDPETDTDEIIKDLKFNAAIKHS